MYNIIVKRELKEMSEVIYNPFIIPPLLPYRLKSFRRRANYERTKTAGIEPRRFGFGYKLQNLSPCVFIVSEQIHIYQIYFPALRFGFTYKV